MYKNSLNNIICHLSWLKKLSLTDAHPLKPIHEFLIALWVIIFWVRVTRKMLNLNWKKIHSIILFVTCHGWRNFPLLIHIPLYPFVNFQNPMSYYFLSLSFDPPPPHPYMTHPTPSWPTPTHPTPTPSWPTRIPPHPTPGTFLGTKEPFFMGCFTMSPSYELLFSELESLIKCWMWIGKKFTQ